MVSRNLNFKKLNANYLFTDILKKKNALLAENPNADIISLCIGDTTEPLTPYITRELAKASEALGTREGYRGYGPAFGYADLREKIAEVIYDGRVSPDAIFISDGAKCDIGRLQVLFGSDVSIAVQDPTYPAYIDSAVIIGQTGIFSPEYSGYEKIVYMPCNIENNFFPDLSTLSRTDLIFFCSPNNPTGAVANKRELTELVAFAKANKSIIIFDSAYASFIADDDFPSSIFEIEGAEEVAIETGSFSKLAGFTGVRLGWSVVPQKLRFDDGTSVKDDWERMQATYFNGASNIVQHGGISALEKEGQKEVQELVRFYLENAKLLKQAFIEIVHIS